LHGKKKGGEWMKSELFHEHGEIPEQHLRAIQILVKEFKRSDEEITHLYSLVLQEYEKEATVKVFLPILVGKKIREMIKTESQ
jgi:hypothetical protein